jgi:hypothetical protein
MINRIFNERWFIFQFKKNFFLSKEISSLPPLVDMVDRESFLFFDIDFPDAEVTKTSFSKFQKVVAQKDKILLFYFYEDGLHQTDDYDKIAITSIFFKNGIDFLRSTVLKEHIS